MSKLQYTIIMDMETPNWTNNSLVQILRRFRTFQLQVIVFTLIHCKMLPVISKRCCLFQLDVYCASALIVAQKAFQYRIRTNSAHANRSSLLNAQISMMSECMIRQLGASDLIVIIHSKALSQFCSSVSWLKNEYIIFRVVRLHHHRIHGVSTGLLHARISSS